MEINHPRMLVVDDEEDIRYVLQEMLHAEGYEVATAEGGHEGIERVKAGISIEEKFDLILIDLVMPEIDGIQMLRTVKQLDPDIGTVMITGYASVDTAVRCMRLGAYDYITKPFRMSEVTARIEEAFHKHRLILKTKQLVQELEQKNSELDRVRTEIEQWNKTLEQKVGQQTQELKETAEFLSCVFHAITDGIFILDREFTIVDVNPGILRIYGLQSREQAVGERCYKAYRGRTEVCDGCPCRTTFKTGDPQNQRTSIQDPQGQSTTWDFFTYPLIGEDGAVEKIIVYARNVTEEAQLQQQLIYSERMAAMGEMAAQIGHELNNYLGGIWGNAQLIPINIRSGALNRAIEKADLIYENVARMERFTKRLMDFTGVHVQKMPCDLNAIVQETFQFLKPQNRYDRIAFATELEENLPRIQADPNQIQQVLLNLFSNSADAMQEGEIRVRTAYDPAGDWIELSVSDNGPGIPEAIQAKVFEPHFSMRKNGHGFGLSVCYRIVEGHRGTIEVESEVGKGTTFRIRLPGHEETRVETEGLDSGTVLPQGTQAA